jgi:hypothetical protein
MSEDFYARNLELKPANLNLFLCWILPQKFTPRWGPKRGGLQREKDFIRIVIE